MSVLVLVVACAAVARSFAEPSSSRDDEVVIVQSYFREVGLRIKDNKLFPTQRGGRRCNESAWNCIYNKENAEECGLN